MKTIKKYWEVIIGFLIMLFTLGMITKKVSDNKTKKLDDAINDNENEVEKLEGKIEVIEEQRTEIKTDVKQHEELIDALEEKKENIVVKERTTSDAKENILQKTNRGHKPKKK
jgi:chromosome segregation ATPase